MKKRFLLICICFLCLPFFACDLFNKNDLDDEEKYEDLSYDQFDEVYKLDSNIDLKKDLTEDEAEKKITDLLNSDSFKAGSITITVDFKDVEKDDTKTTTETEDLLDGLVPDFSNNKVTVSACYKINDDDFSFDVTNFEEEMDNLFKKADLTKIEGYFDITFENTIKFIEFEIKSLSIYIKDGFMYLSLNMKTGFTTTETKLKIDMNEVLGFIESMNDDDTTDTDKKESSNDTDKYCIDKYGNIIFEFNGKEDNDSLYRIVISKDCKYINAYANLDTDSVNGSLKIAYELGKYNVTYPDFKEFNLFSVADLFKE